VVRDRRLEANKIEHLASIGFTLLLLLAGYGFGTWAEKNHFKSIIKREEEYINCPAITLAILDPQKATREARLVFGNVVISVDYFKRFLAGLRNLIGGEVTSYEPLLDRARREAILRMKAQANGSDQIINVRLVTASIGGQGNSKGLGSVEVLAYGTAIYYESS